MRTENPKDILERFGPDKGSKRYPRKILGWTKDPKVILERFFGVDKRPKSYPRKILGWTKDPKVILERVWGGQKIQKLS